MGHITRNIANIKEPAKVSLASNPNFVEFEGIGYAREESKAVEVCLFVYGRGIIIDRDSDNNIVGYDDVSEFIITESKTEKSYHFKGSVQSSNYYIYDLEGNVADTLTDCLRSIDFFKTKFEIEQDDKYIYIKSKGYGVDYSFSIKPLRPRFDEFIQIIGDPSDTYNKDESNKVESSIIINTSIEDYDLDEKLEIKETLSGQSHVFYCTRDKTKVSNNTFYLDFSSNVAAENFKMCLLKNPFFGNNFDFKVKGSTINIIAKGYGKKYMFDIISQPSFANLEQTSYYSINNDSITNDFGDSEIHLDIYKNTGTASKAQDVTNTGAYTTTLSKSYFGKPLWFDVNTIWQNENRYSDAFLTNKDWCDTGTCNNYRFLAKRFNGYNNETFYYSDILYALTGYTRNLEENSLTEYIYDGVRKIKPLTRQPNLPHIKAQTQYFNFFMSDSLLDNDELYKLGILYKIYSQSGSYLGRVVMHEQKVSLFSPVNTIHLDIDAAIENYPQAGIVKVCLWRNGEEMSHPLTFNILPHCLYKVNDFAFLNSLGGWSSFNFGGTQQTDFKSEATTIYQTQTPGYTPSGRIKSVFNKEVSEQFIVQTTPVTAEVADWLKELSASIAVYELSTNRYAIVDELNVKHNSKDDLFTLQMKYHYSDSYNANIK